MTTTELKSWGCATSAALFVVCICGSALAAETPVRLEIELPEGVSSGTLLWGLQHAGLEIDRGRQEVVKLVAAANGGPIVLDVRVDDRIRRDDQPVLAYLCLNHDDLESYIPSFGDVYAVVRLRQSDGRWAGNVARAGWSRRQPARPEAIVNIHYHRLEGDYDNASLWTWDQKLKRTPEEQKELLAVGRDDFGLIFQLDADLYGGPDDGIGLLPRLNADWQFKDGGDRFWSPSMGQHVYLVQGRRDVYTEVPEVSPKVATVTLDATNNLTIRFTHRLPTADWTKDKFRVTTEMGQELTVKEVYPFKHRGDRCAVYSIETVEPLEFTAHTYTLHVEGFGSKDARPGHVLHGAMKFYDAKAQLGATYSPEQTTFRVFAPTASQVTVVVADRPRARSGLTEVGMKRNEKGVWTAVVPGDQAGRYYAYRLGGIGFDPHAEVTDIYATCTQGRATRSLIVDLDKTDPPAFTEYTYAGPMSPADAIIYEMHVRDFTIAPNSGVQNKGKYLGLTESGTHLPDEPATRTGIDHLVELGVTHVQIMPVQDFDNREDGTDDYNWGYMPINFNSPEGWYALDPKGPGRIRELKELISALHERGIGVIMDVVYNHTAGRAGFNRLVPGYYFRMTDDGRFSNGSGCGNEFKSENPMARKFLLDSVKFWVTEYKVDGFRFDLMGLTDLETMKQIKQELEKLHPGILVYGEPWTGGATPLSPITDKHQVRGTGVGAFYDSFRDAVKGDRDGGAPGFIQVGDRPLGVLQGLQGGIDDWTQDPVDSINYFEAHDNLTTWDKLLQSVPHASDEERKRMGRFGALILFVSQGAVFIHSGQEFCRSKHGSHNSYNLPDEINRIDWSLKKTNADVYDYYRGLIALRKAHPVFRLRTREDVKSRVFFGQPPNDRAIVYSLNGQGLEGESARQVLVLLNGCSHPLSFDLPEGGWSIHVDADRATTGAFGNAAGKVELPPHSGMLLVQ